MAVVVKAPDGSLSHRSDSCLATSVHRNAALFENVFKVDSRLARLELEVKSLQGDLRRVFELICDLSVAYKSEDTVAPGASLASLIAAARTPARDTAELAHERAVAEVIGSQGSETLPAALKATLEEPFIIATDVKNKEHTSVCSDQTDLIEPPHLGDIVNISHTAPAEYQGHVGVVTKTDHGKCEIVVLDKGMRISIGECWQSFLDISTHSRCARLGTHVTIIGLRGQRNQHINGLTGIVAAHPREGHPTFIRKESSLDRPRFVVCVRFDNPAVTGEDMALIDPRFLSSEVVLANLSRESSKCKSSVSSQQGSTSPKSMIIMDDRASEVACDEDDCVVELITSSVVESQKLQEATKERDHRSIVTHCKITACNDGQSEVTLKGSPQEAHHFNIFQHQRSQTPLPQAIAPIFTPPRREMVPPLGIGSLHLPQVERRGETLQIDPCPSRYSFITNETRTVSPQTAATADGIPIGLIPIELQTKLIEGPCKSLNHGSSYSACSHEKPSQSEQMTTNVLRDGLVQRSTSPTSFAAKRSPLWLGPARCSFNGPARAPSPTNSTAQTSSFAAPKETVSTLPCDAVTIVRSQSVPGLRPASTHESLLSGHSGTPSPTNSTARRSAVVPSKDAVSILPHDSVTIARSESLPGLRAAGAHGSLLSGHTRAFSPIARSESFPGLRVSNARDSSPVLCQARRAYGAHQVPVASVMQRTHSRQDMNIQRSFTGIQAPTRMSSVGVTGSTLRDQASLQPGWSNSSVERLSSHLFKDSA